MPTPASNSSSAQRLGKGMIAITWVVLLGMLTWFFNDKVDAQRNPNQQAQARLNEGIHELVLQRNRQGHYVAPGNINGQPVEFLLDTGATLVSIPQPLAQRLGLKPGIPLESQTANGTVTTYATVIENIELGGIVLRNIRASINPGQTGNDVLLGMSFLQQLELTQHGNTLTLKEYAR
ncbi:MAG: retropepsin-like aspartic protease [Gammaproteobacteria bacterium]